MIRIAAPSLQEDGGEYVNANFTVISILLLN